ncbi:MAG: hypothetical protein CMJ78_09030 [Planctomycetaceae bacterium]|nr:hypothetical protein [Planctomycetaceae bacterium]
MERTELNTTPNQSGESVSNEDEHKKRSLFKRNLSVLVGAVGVGIVAIVSSSCSEAPPPIIPGANTTGGAGGGAPTRCKDLIESVIDTLQPNRLGISSDGETAITLLNDWDDSCGQEIPAADEAALQLRSKLLESNARTRADEDRFVNRDMYHIRDALWYKQLLEFAAGQSDDDLGTVVNLFYHIVRNVELISDQEEVVPLMPFDAYLLGRATAETRALLLANILRQLRIDSVIINAGGGSKAWCMGVLLNANVYLFDPTLGLPIPSEKDDASSHLVQIPATLAEAQDNDALLRALDLSDDQPYPLTAESLKSSTASIIASSGYFAPRMARLQRSLVGDQSMVIYDPVEDTDLGAGTVARIVDSCAEAWKAGDLSVWSFPEEQLVAAQDLSDKQTERLRILMHPLEVPVYIENAVILVDLTTLDNRVVRARMIEEGQVAYTIEIPNTGQVVKIPKAQVKKLDPIALMTFTKPARFQYKTRAAQMQGDFGLAIKKYLSVQLWNELPPTQKGIFIPDVERRIFISQLPTPIRDMHRRAAADALFWTGMAQYELGEYKSAEESLSRYVNRYPGGKWLNSVRYTAALSMAQRGKFEEAAKELRRITKAAPQSRGYLLLARRWESQASK